MNILRQAAAVGIRKAVITSSSVSALNPDRLEDMYDSSKVLSESDWNQTTREQALKEEHDDMWVYMAAWRRRRLQRERYGRSRTRIRRSTLRRVRSFFSLSQCPLNRICATDVT